MSRCFSATFFCNASASGFTPATRGPSRLWPCAAVFFSLRSRARSRWLPRVIAPLPRELHVQWAHEVAPAPILAATSPRSRPWARVFTRAGGMTGWAMTRLRFVLFVLIALVPRACMGVIPSPEAVGAFKQWLLAINVSMDAMVWPVQTASGMAAVASRFLNPGESLCEVPPRFLLSTLAFQNNRKLNSLRPLPWRKYAPHDTSYLQRIRLALVLLHEVELGARSAWAPYVGILPRHPYPHWSASELAEFQDEELLKAFRIRDDEIYNEFDVVRLAMDAAANYTFDPAVYSRENWIWARETVDTRAHGVASDEADDEVYATALCLVPLCDLFKHSSHEPWVPRFVDVRPPVPDPWKLSVRYLSLALKPLQRSTELLVRHFQEADNTMFLVVYGFVERDNPYDRARASFFFPPWCTDSAHPRAGYRRWETFAAGTVVRRAAV